MGRARSGDIVMKTGSVKTGEQGGKDRRKIIGRVPEDRIQDLDALPSCSEPGRLPIGGIAVKIEGGYRRL